MVHNHLLLVILDRVVFVVGQVPIGMGTLEGGSHEGGSPRVFPTNGEHMSWGE
jgi:hypothetical protein